MNALASEWAAARIPSTREALGNILGPRSREEVQVGPEGTQGTAWEWLERTELLEEMPKWAAGLLKAKRWRTDDAEDVAQVALAKYWRWLQLGARRGVAFPLPPPGTGPLPPQTPGYRRIVAMLRHCLGYAVSDYLRREPSEWTSSIEDGATTEEPRDARDDHYGFSRLPQALRPIVPHLATGPGDVAGQTFQHHLSEVIDRVSSMDVEGDVVAHVRWIHQVLEPNERTLRVFRTVQRITARRGLHKKFESAWIRRFWPACFKAHVDALRPAIEAVSVPEPWATWSRTTVGTEGDGPAGASASHLRNVYSVLCAEADGYWATHHLPHLRVDGREVTRLHLLESAHETLWRMIVKKYQVDGMWLAYPPADYQWWEKAHG